jgi:hypothetical protein
VAFGLLVSVVNAQLPTFSYFGAACEQPCDSYLSVITGCENVITVDAQYFSCYCSAYFGAGQGKYVNDPFVRDNY